MTSLPPGSKSYSIAIIAIGAFTAAAGLPFLRFEQIPLLVVLVGLSALTSIFTVSLPVAQGGSTISFSYAVDFVSLILLGPHMTMLVGMVGALSRSAFASEARKAPTSALFSMASVAIAIQTAGHIHQALGGQAGQLGLSEGAGPLVGAATAYFIVNTITIATTIALRTGQRIGQVWNDQFLWSAPSYFVGAAAAAMIAAGLGRFEYWLAPLLAIPVYLTYRAYRVFFKRIQEQQRYVQQVSDLQLATIEALAQAIDAKDQLTQGHLQRVRMCAAGLARAIGLSEAEVEGVKTAALLHDIGKLAVPEHILSKPGALSPEEFRKIRAHPEVGAAIISGVPFPYPVAAVIRSHHERWDGQGYPIGLQGERIPLGARILSVVDYFDALTTERPYHKPMAEEPALKLLHEEAGKALDPRLVARFIDLWPQLRADLVFGERASVKTDAAATDAAAGRLAPQARLDPSKVSIFKDIALAHREIYALYEIAQAMGSSLGVADTMALISSKLSTLVPFSCCALFLHDEESDMLRCRFALGTDAAVIQQVALQGGEGVAGWVARHREPLVNANPTVDLELAGLDGRSTSLQSALACPLIFNERLIGTLVAYYVEADFYDDDHRRLLDRVSEQAAAVIYNSILFEQTQEDSLTDALTGLPNTRFLTMHLTRELARADRLKSSVAILVLDLDNFKEINDSHGHQVGDRALCEIARALRSGIRPYDACIRYAGDEFIIVLSGCGREESDGKRIELQRAIEELFFEAREGCRLSLAASAGAAVFPDDGATYETLLSTADQRMYADKTLRKRRAAASVAFRVEADSHPLSELPGIDLDRPTPRVQ